KSSGKCCRWFKSSTANGKWPRPEADRQTAVGEKLLGQYAFERFEECVALQLMLVEDEDLAVGAEQYRREVFLNAAADPHQFADAVVGRLGPGYLVFGEIAPQRFDLFIGIEAEYLKAPLLKP